MAKLLLVLVTCVFSSIGTAQSGLERFCQRFLDINIRDESSLFSTAQSFDLVRTILFEQNELEYSTAQTLQAELEIPIFEVVDISLGGETTEQNWTGRRDTFFNDVLNANTANQEVRSQVSRINAAFFDTADRCINTLSEQNQNQEAFFPIVTMLSYRQFEVDVTYQINPANPRPLAIDFNTDPIEITCRPALPYTFNAAKQTRSFRCAKPEEEPVFLTVVADPLDDQGAFELPNGGDIAVLRRDVDELRARLAGLSPIARGTVAAFNLAECPSSWSNFSAGTGRSIIGVGEAQGLTTRTLMQQGGEEAHVLTIEEMPSHTHVITNPGADVGVSAVTGVSNTGGRRLLGQTENTRATGSDAPHNNMPPFVALLFCQKD